MREKFPRRIALEGAVNFRDIGGYPAIDGRRVRWRRIFRSDSLSRLTNADQQHLATLGVRRLVDFRLAEERRHLPNRLDPSSDLKTVEIGFMAEGVTDMLRAVARGAMTQTEIEGVFINQYRRFVTDHAAEFAHAITYALHEENLPLLFHCTSGKDRTGFVISTLLLALGTPKEIILGDYTLTNSYMRDISHLFDSSTPDELVRTVMTAQAKYLEAAFEQIQTSYGSVDAYLEVALNLDDAKRLRLIALLTEEISNGDLTPNSHDHAPPR